MAEVEMPSSDSDDELALEVLSGFVKTVYKTVKEEGILSTDESVTKPVVVTESKAKAGKPKPLNESQPFQDLLFRAAESLNLQNTDQESDKPNIPERDNLDRVLMPLGSDISQQCHNVWKKPSSLPPVNFRMQGNYHGRRDDPLLTNSHPVADSPLVFIASGGRSTKAENFPIRVREPKLMDIIGKRIYLEGGLGLKQANMSEVMNRYNQHLWSQLTDILEALPEDSKSKALELQKEATALAENSVQVAKEQADVSARTMDTGILQRRRVWLGVSGCPPNVVKKVLDLPFDGFHLFDSSTEEVLERTKGDPHRGMDVSQFEGRGPLPHPLKSYKRPYSNQQA